MIIYNVTVKVENSIADDWVKWIMEEHIPEIINTGCFQKGSLLRLLECDDSEGPTYAVQYFAESKSQYNTYISQFSEKMRQKGFEKWGNKFIAFRSVMQVVN
jgi:hypothetical protein